MKGDTMDKMHDYILKKLASSKPPIDRLFPDLKDGVWKEVELERDLKNFTGDISNPIEFSRWINELKHRMGADYLYGGLGENRRNMVNQYPSLKGSKNITHIGTDVWVPSGTDVAAADGGEVENIFIDPLKEGGWGGRVMVLTDSGEHVIYGHLDPRSILVDDGEPIHPGVVIGKVGGPEVNGGHAAHLHYQVMSEKEVHEYRNLEDIDGYK